MLAKDELFAPLGIEDVEWNCRLLEWRAAGERCDAGAPARLGEAWSIGAELPVFGMTGQIVPSAWIADFIKPRNNGPGLFPTVMTGGSGARSAAGRVVEWAGAMGWGGQRLMIVPDLGMVALVHAWLPNRMSLPETILLNEFILPAAMPS